MSSEHSFSTADSDGTSSLRPDFSSCPPIFVLSTHLSLEELHEVEESLVRRGARLTYDAAEAAIVLGRVGQKKRAALELRSRGVWTEEIGPVERPVEPAVKRRRMEVEEKSDVIDLCTETEDEEDGMTGQHHPANHLRRPSLPRPDEQVDVKVVKLEWLDRSLEAAELVPIPPFVVYQARKIDPPGSSHPIEHHDTSRILQRAREDAATKPPPASFASRRSKEDASSQRVPKLYRQTTSEHDEAVPLPPTPDWVKNNVLYACMRSAPLHPPNEKFMEQLIKIRKTRELTLDEIGVRAYSTSIAAIAAYPYEFNRASEVLSLPGCDTKIATLFSEFKQSPTGTLTAANLLDSDPVFKVLREFNNIWGVGAKTARDFYYSKQWRDLDDIVEYGWNALSRVQQIGVKYYDEFQDPIPRPESESIAKIISRHAHLVRPTAVHDGHGIDCILVGGYRRGKETSADVDLVLSHRDESVTKNLIVDIVASLESEGWITHTLALHLTTSARDQQTLPFRGDAVDGRHFDSLDKALVVWQDPHFDDDDDNATTSPGESPSLRRKRNPNPHRRVDIIISPWRTVGCAVIGWSGDTTFQRDLRRYAKKAHGWKFDSSGVRERTSGGNVVDLEQGGETWEERERLVLEGLGVGFREAWFRCTR